jgi:hypothetical protein
MMRTPVTAVAVLAALVLGGSASWATPLPAPAVAPTVPGAPSATTPERAAVIEANRLLGQFILPAGSTRIGEETVPEWFEAGALLPLTVNSVSAHGFWHVDSNPQAVIDWIEVHLPAGARLSGPAVADPSPAGEWSVAMSLSGVPHVLASRRLLARAAPDPHGGAVLRVDAQVVWIGPAYERIPRGVRALTITDGTSEPLTIRDPVIVKRIVRLVDRLPIAANPATRCPPDEGPNVSITFLPDAADPPLAEAIADGSGCGLVTVRNQGQLQPPAAGGPRLVRELQALLGVTFIQVS